MRTFIAAGSVFGLILTVPGLARSEFCPINCPSGLMALGDLAPISGPSAAFGQPAAKALKSRSVPSIRRVDFSEFTLNGWSG